MAPALIRKESIWIPSKAWRYREERSLGKSSILTLTTNVESYMPSYGSALDMMAVKLAKVPSTNTLKAYR